MDRRTQGKGEAIAYFAQGPLYSDLATTKPIDNATFEVQFIGHFIDGQIQPYIDISSIKVSDGKLNLISTQTKFFYDIGDIHEFKVIAGEGLCFQCIKKVLIRVDTSRVREIQIFK